MRALTKAAALLLAGSVVAESMRGPVRRVSATETIPAAYITLNVPVDGAETEIVPFRIELVEADEACSPAKLSVDGQRLEQNAHGFGQGALSLDNGVDITSNWTFTCHSLKQAITMNIHSVNGNPAVDTSFTANFYQTTPVQISSVENASKVEYLHQHTTVTESLSDSGDEHDGIEDSYEGGYEESEQKALAIGGGRGSVDVDVSRLKDLREQARELAALIRNQENVIMNKLEHKLQAKLASEPAPTPLAECRDVRCAFKALVYKFQHSHEEVCESSSGWRTFFGCAPREDEEDLDQGFDDYEYEMDMEDVYWEQEEYFYSNYEEEMTAAYYEATRARMLLLVAKTAFIFGIAVFCMTAFIRRLTSGRRNRPRTSNELPLYQAGHYFDEPKTLISFGAADEDKVQRRQEAGAGAGYPDEKAILRAADEAANSKRENDKSVAEEISELREAASVVSDLVAVEAAERRTSVDYDDEAPPAYEHVDERDHSL